MKRGYLDTESIEYNEELKVWIAFYVDSDGGELGEAELRSFGLVDLSTPEVSNEVVEFVFVVGA